MEKMEAKQISNEVLKTLREKFPQWQIASAGGRFSDTTLTMKLQISVPNSAGTIITKEISDFERYHSTYGLSKDDLYKEFTFKDERYKVGGLLINRRAYPILGIRISDNKRFLFKSEDILKWIKR